IRGITRARAILRGIHGRLSDNDKEPFEQDLIYGLHYGTRPAEARTKSVNGVTITTRILHQTGTRLSDVGGADLLYEIPGLKYVDVQYKRPDSGRRVILNESQLDELIQNCPADCDFHRRSSLRCGSWYAIIEKRDARMMPACIASGVFNSNQTAAASDF